MMTILKEDIENSLSLGVFASIASIGLNSIINLGFTYMGEFIFGVIVSISMFVYLRVHRLLTKDYS